ncbi:MAG: hypothetical protein ACJ76Z_05665 [Thermoleophilaceae bacterium]
MACGDAENNIANHSWTGGTSDSAHLEFADRCGSGGVYGGLYSRDVLAAGTTTGTPKAGWSFLAAPGTRVTAASFNRWLSKNDDDDWQPAIVADGLTLESCSIIYPASTCGVGTTQGSRIAMPVAEAQSLSVESGCRPNPANACANGGTIHTVSAVLYGATVTLTDSSAPSVSNISGSLFGGGYVTGTKSVDFDASDNVGIRSARVYVDGVAQPAATYPCDFTYTVPCSDKTSASLALDTHTIADGTHNVDVAATDPADNEAKSGVASVTVDNGAPASPEGVAVDGGDGWHSDNSFGVSWSNPSGQVAPITVARYQVCSADSSSCGSEQRATALDISRLDGISVPSAGEWTLRIWLEDAAGNRDASTAATATLRYDSPPSVTSSLSPTPGTAAASPTNYGSVTQDTTASELQSNPGIPTTGAGLTVASNLGRLPRSPARLRITLARFAHGRLAVRGRTAKSAAGAVAIRLHVDSRVVTMTRTLNGGRFRLVLPTRTRPRTLSMRFRGNVRFLPQTASARIR